MAGPILIGYDGTEGAKAALAEGLRLAAALEAEVVVVNAYWVNPLGGETADLLAVVHERAKELVREAVERAQSAGVRARGELINAQADEALADLAESTDAQMIVVGSYGERPLRALILGSTPHRLMHLTEVPVLVVRGPESRGR